MKILKLALPYILHPLIHILNSCIYQSNFPQQWKSARVTPLHKGGDKTNPSNYRPISVLPILSKVYERIILNTLLQHLHKNHIISDRQSGFRKNHSCGTAMHHLHTTWTGMVKAKQTVAILFLDFHKAFDMVNHQLLLNKLREIWVGGKLFSTLQSYLSNRSQCVLINGAISSRLAVTSGVP